MDGLFGILKENGEIHSAVRRGDLKAAATRRPNATLAVHARVKPGGSVGLGGSGVETFTRSVRCPPSSRSRSGGRLTLHRQEGYAKCQLCKNNQSHARASHICFSIRNGWRLEGHDGRGNEKMNVFFSSPLRKIQIDPATRHRFL